MWSCWPDEWCRYLGARHGVSKHFEIEFIARRGLLVVASRSILLRIDATCCVCGNPSSYTRHGQGHRETSQGIRRNFAGAAGTNSFRARGDASLAAFLELRRHGLAWMSIAG